MKHVTTVTVVNDLGTKLTATVALTRANDGTGNFEIDVSAVDANGNAIETLDKKEDVFGFFGLVNGRLGELLGIVGTYGTEASKDAIN